MEFQEVSGNYNKDLRHLSTLDKEILKILLNPHNGKRSSEILSERTGSPISTIQRRRRQLEKEYLELSYTLIIEKFGWRRVDLLISTTSGKTDAIAKQLLTREEVVYVGKSIGEHTIDLRTEIIVKDNAELLDVLEEVKAMEGVRDTIWSEIVHVVGKKRSIPSYIIDRF
ncbi:MAG: Lrp/AsnC family transcriptional regulator [Nitrososphaeraceae archaeon]